MHARTPHYNDRVWKDTFIYTIATDVRSGQRREGPEEGGAKGGLSSYELVNWDNAWGGSDDAVRSGTNLSSVGATLAGIRELARLFG